MKWFTHDGAGLAWREDGDPDGKTILFINSLGTDLRLWDDTIAHLPPGLRFVRMDTRGHGLSDAPAQDYTLEQLTRDAAALLDHLQIDSVRIVGVSLGGLMGQALARLRPDTVRAVVLSNTAAKIGTPEIWEPRIAAVKQNGLASIADAVLERWFGAAFHSGPTLPLWRNMLIRTPDHGYTGCCAAINAADLRHQTAQITQPALVVGGTEDGSTTPEMTRALAEALPNARYHEFAGVGHLPCAEVPEAFAAQVTAFLEDTKDA
jgi:3-oxoadipate enol-lactonase